MAKAPEKAAISPGRVIRSDERNADDRLNARFGRCLGEFERAEKIVGVSQPKRRQFQSVGPLEPALAGL